MSDQTTPTVGKLLTGKEGRDAIHFALAPMTSDVCLIPGRRVGIVNGKAHPNEPHIGIVDPFLAYSVQPGEWFWLFLFPGTITSLRHAWSHPAFLEDTGEAERNQSSEVREAMAWLKNYAYHELNTYCKDADEALAKLLSDVKEGVIHAYGTDLSSAGDVDRRLWGMLAVIGIHIADPENLRYSCSC